MSTLVGITGATGHIGGAAARHLADGGYATRLIVRDPARAPSLPRSEVVAASYDDAGACRAAYEGLDTLFLVSATESADRVAQHRTAVDAAVAAGVRQLVYLSFVGAGPHAGFLLARDHGATEEMIAAAAVEWTFLRDNLYTDAIRTMFGEDGVIRGPAGRGKVASVAQADVAAVVARVLEDPTAHRGATYELTGPAALTLDEVAALLTAATGTPHRYVAETVPEAFASRARYDAPRWLVEAWVSTYTAIADGDLSSDLPAWVFRRQLEARLGLAAWWPWWRLCLRISPPAGLVLVAVLAAGEDRRLVAEVGEVCAREPGRVAQQVDDALVKLLGRLPFLRRIPGRLIGFGTASYIPVHLVTTVSAQKGELQSNRRPLFVSSSNSNSTSWAPDLCLKSIFEAFGLAPSMSHSMPAAPRVAVTVTSFFFMAPSCFCSSVQEHGSPPC